MATVAAACSPSPGMPVFSGGTYALRLAVPPQHASESFLVAGLGTCTITVDSPEILLAGATLTVGEATLDETESTATLADGKVDVPRQTVALGTVSLECAGNPVGSLDVAIDVQASATLKSVVFDGDDNTLTLVEPTISIPDAKLIVTGWGSSLPPIDLPPIDVTVPTVSIQV